MYFVHIFNKIIFPWLIPLVYGIIDIEFNEDYLYPIIIIGMMRFTISTLYSNSIFVMEISAYSVKESFYENVIMFGFLNVMDRCSFGYKGTLFHLFDTPKR